MTDSRPILVLGAAGFLGLQVVDALLARGLVPRCGRRRRTNVLVLRPKRVPLVHADLDDGPQLVEAMRGCGVVVHCAGHYPRLSVDHAATLDTALRQSDAVLDAAAEAGVERVVYVSSTATVARRTDGSPSTESDTYARAPGFGVYHDVKWRMEERFAAEDRVGVVTACPAACIGPWDLRVGTSALLVGVARGLDPVYPDGDVAIVDARDVGEAVAALATRADPPSRVLLSGSQHRMRRLMRDLARRFDAPSPRPPLSAAAAVAYADAEETRAARAGGRPALSREIVDLVVHGPVIDGSFAERALGLSYTPLPDTLDAWEIWARRMRILQPMPAEAT